MISRVLVELFSEPSLAGGLAFRGGTAIHKLLFASPLRFSDDIDLVQVASGPIGNLMKAPSSICELGVHRLRGVSSPEISERKSTGPNSEATSHRCSCLGPGSMWMPHSKA